MRAQPFQELAPFAVLLLSAAALFAFIELAEEMQEGETRAFDEAVLRMLRSPDDLADPVGPWWLEAMSA